MLYLIIWYMYDIHFQGQFLNSKDNLKFIKYFKIAGIAPLILKQLSLQIFIRGEDGGILA